MSSGPITRVNPERFRRIACVDIVRALLVHVDADRQRRIDDYIDYFGSGGVRGTVVMADPDSEPLPPRGRCSVSAERRSLSLRRALRRITGVGALWALASACAVPSASPPGAPDADRDPAP
jgi:hypothetical protein